MIIDTIDTENYKAGVSETQAQKKSIEQNWYKYKYHIRFRISSQMYK